MNRPPNIAVSIALSVVLGVATNACGSEVSKPAADLPGDWQSARAVENLHQTACEGSPYDGTKEAMTASASDRSIEVIYEPAHFRCAQSVQGFMKTSAASVDVLVQPVDMNPASVAKCDCMYGIHMNVPVQSGNYSVSVYRRWDHLSGADDALKIGSATVTIP